MSDYKDKVIGLQEMSEKLAACGHTMMADDYRWAASTIEELLKRNDAQSGIITDKLTVISSMTSHLHDVEAELQRVIGRLHEVESERDAMLQILKEQADCDHCKHNDTPLPCIADGLDMMFEMCEENCGYEKTVCCGCGGSQWEFCGLEEK